MSDLISRQAAIDACHNYEDGKDLYFFGDVVEERLQNLPSAHPEMDEWCTDCREYDHERHCCPRHNSVIRGALAERKTGRWEKVYGDHVYLGLRPWTVCCSECGMIGNGTRYCPNCGAKMEVANE